MKQELSVFASDFLRFLKRLTQAVAYEDSTGVTGVIHRSHRTPIPVRLGHGSCWDPRERKRLTEGSERDVAALHLSEYTKLQISVGEICNRVKRNCFDLLWGLSSLCPTWTHWKLMRWHPDHICQSIFKSQQLNSTLPLPCYYYYYYRKMRFWWHNVKRLQGHLTNTKQNSTSETQRNEQSIYQIQTAAEL